MLADLGQTPLSEHDYLSHPRIAPDGTRVAFLEHPLWGDDRGYLWLADASGRVTRIAGEAAAEQGIAWSPDSRDVWYAALMAGTQARVVWAVSPGQAPRQIVQVPGDITVCAIADDGRLLFSHETIAAAQMVASPGGPERDVSVAGHAASGAVSADGTTIAFSEGRSSDYLVFVRKLDGSPAVEIGEGLTMGITPDARQVVALVPSQPTRIRVMRTGAGETRTLDIAPVSADSYFVSWFPDGKEFVFLGHEGGAPPRAYRVSIDGGPARRVTSQSGPEFWNRVSADGRFLLQAPGVGQGSLRLPAGGTIVELRTGAVRSVPLVSGDQPIGWDAGGRHVFVAQESDGGGTIYRVDLSTLHRDVWQRIQPADPAGLLSVGRFFVTPSGNAYAYGTIRYLSALYTYATR